MQVILRNNIILDFRFHYFWLTGKVFQGNQSWLAEAGCGHSNSLGCGGREDLEPQGGPGARCEGFQEMEGEPGLDGPDIY